MATEVHWHLDNAGGDPTRGRVEITEFVVGEADIDSQMIRQLLDAALRSARRLEEVAKETYASVRGVKAYTNRSNRAIFAGISITDPHFFFQEWDTELHWPPFGKHSELAAWARDHGMDERAAFFIARKMAPLSPTNARVSYISRDKTGREYVRSHLMTVGGLGGTESDHRSPRMVATRGQYAVTDALNREAEILADEASAIITQMLESVLPEGEL